MGHIRLTDSDQSATWPSFLRDAVNRQQKLDPKPQHPVLIDMTLKGSERELELLTTKNMVTHVVDNYDEQLAELYLSQDAHLYRANEEVQISSIRDLLQEHYHSLPSWKLGTWAYYPWNGELVHVIEKSLFQELRSIRNRDLITKQEQSKLAEFRVACLGMSVGSSSALALILSGISDKIKLVDGAVISGSNLNRILTGVSSVGTEKATIIQRQLYEMNPYIEVHIIPGKLASTNIQELFSEPWPVDLVIDEIDDLEMKIRVRLEARKRKIPVLMATELGDSVMLDIERFDTEKDLQLFHGLVGNIEDVLDKKDMSQREWMKYATTIIGTKNVPLNMQQSLLKIGTKVVTHPQLGATAMMTGGVLAFATKQIALGRNIPSTRKTISLEEIFLPEHKTLKHRRARRAHTKVVRRSLDAI